MGGSAMYCIKCGKQNDDDASFCKFCGAPLSVAAGPEYQGRDWRRHDHRAQNECDGECQRGSRGFSWIWGLVVILIGVWVITNWAIPNMNLEGMPSWMKDLNFWWVIPLLIGACIIAIGARIIARHSQPPR